MNKPLLIAHRGNINGPNPELENRPDYLLSAIKDGYHVECDLWLIDNKLYLGHDKPEYNILIEFLLDIKDYLFCHCKNIDSLYYLLNNYPEIHCFFHNSDECTLTSKNIIWTYPGKKITEKSILLLPERTNNHIIFDCYGICTDYPSKIHI